MGYKDLLQQCAYWYALKSRSRGSGDDLSRDLLDEWTRFASTETAMMITGYLAGHVVVNLRKFKGLHSNCPSEKQTAHKLRQKKTSWWENSGALWK